jgi:hypothetical protein
MNFYNHFSSKHFHLEKSISCQHLGLIYTGDICSIVVGKKANSCNSLASLAESQARLPTPAWPILSSPLNSQVSMEWLGRQIRPLSICCLKKSLWVLATKKNFFLPFLFTRPISSCDFALS